MNKRISLRQALGMWLLGVSPQEMKSVTTGQLLPVWQSGKPIWTDWSTDKAVREGFKTSTWVYACIHRIMKAASSVPWVVSQQVKPGEWEVVPGHPLEELLKKPNPYMSGQDLIERLTAHLYLGGNGLWTKIRVRGAVVELWPIGPDGIKPVPSRAKFVERYEYERDGVKHSIKPEDIIHVMFIDPANPYWGMSPLQAGARTVDTDIEAVKWNKVSLQNRAITDGVFSFKEPLTKDQWEEARRQVREQHQGVDNARTPWVLGGDATWHQMSLSPAEMDFIESRRMTREEICAIFQVPPPMVGIYDHATLANIETARDIFWLDTVIPFLEDLQSAFNLALTPEFGPDLRLEFDVSNVPAVQKKFQERVKVAKEIWSMGVPFNEVNQRLELGFDEISGGDVGYLPMNLLPAGMTAQEPGEEPEEGEGKTLLNKAWNLSEENQKAAYWKAFDRRRQNWEKKVAQIVGRRFRDEGQKVAEAYEEGRDVDGVVDGQRPEWVTMMTAIYAGVMEDFGQETGEALAKSIGPTSRKFEFDPWLGEARNWIEAVVAEKVVQITRTTKDMIKQEITAGFEEGESTQEIARRIRKLYQDFSVRRSMTIARTEVVAASNAGSHFAAEQTGLDYQRVWLSSRDERVREDHADMDGQRRGKNEPFEAPDGSLLMFPGDTRLGAAASQTVMCRCTEIYEVRR